jgi:IS4 transposase
MMIGKNPEWIEIVPPLCPSVFQRFGYSPLGKIFRHCNRSWIHRLYEALCTEPVARFLRDSRQEQFSVPPPQFSESGQNAGLRSDQRIVLTTKKSRAAYPETLRRVSYVDLDTKKSFVYLTNIFTISAITIADIYKQRWQVELFFRWIKQHLRIKTFYGTSPNAVKTQIWIAISIYLLVAILKKRLDLPGSLHTIMQILEVNIF